MDPLAPRPPASPHAQPETSPLRTLVAEIISGHRRLDRPDAQSRLGEALRAAVRSATPTARAQAFDAAFAALSGGTLPAGPHRAALAKFAAWEAPYRLQALATAAQAHPPGSAAHRQATHQQQRVHAAFPGADRGAQATPNGASTDVERFALPPRAAPRPPTEAQLAQHAPGAADQAQQAAPGRPGRRRPLPTTPEEAPPRPTRPPPLVPADAYTEAAGIPPRPNRRPPPPPDGAQRGASAGPRGVSDLAEPPTGGAAPGTAAVVGPGFAGAGGFVAPQAQAAAPSLNAGAGFAGVGGFVAPRAQAAAPPSNAGPGFAGAGGFVAPRAQAAAPSFNAGPGFAGVGGFVAPRAQAAAPEPIDGRGAVGVGGFVAPARPEDAATVEDLGSLAGAPLERWGGRSPTPDNGGGAPSWQPFGAPPASPFGGRGSGGVGGLAAPAGAGGAATVEDTGSSTGAPLERWRGRSRTRNDGGGAPSWQAFGAPPVRPIASRGPALSQQGDASALPAFSRLGGAALLAATARLVERGDDGLHPSHVTLLLRRLGEADQQATTHPQAWDALARAAASGRLPGPAGVQVRAFLAASGPRQLAVLEQNLRALQLDRGDVGRLLASAALLRGAPLDPQTWAGASQLHADIDLALAVRGLSAPSRRLAPLLAQLHLEPVGKRQLHQGPVLPATGGFGAVRTSVLIGRDGTPTAFIASTAARGAFSKFRPAVLPDGRVLGLRVGRSEKKEGSTHRLDPSNYLPEHEVLEAVQSRYAPERRLVDGRGRVYELVPLADGDLEELTAQLDLPARARALPVALDGLLTDLTKVAAAGYVHRDIKPANVMWHKDGSFGLADYGLAQRGRPRGLQGTPVFMAPELFDAAGLAAAGPKLDVWALGLTAVEMMLGEAGLRHFPLRMGVSAHRDPQAAQQQAVELRAAYAEWRAARQGGRDRTLGPAAAAIAAAHAQMAEASLAVADLVFLQLLEPDPARRPTAEAARAQLRRELPQQHLLPKRVAATLAAVANEGPAGRRRAEVVAALQRERGGASTNA